MYVYVWRVIQGQPLSPALRALQTHTTTPLVDVRVQASPARRDLVPGRTAPRRRSPNWLVYYVYTVMYHRLFTQSAHPPALCPATTQTPLASCMAVTYIYRKYPDISSRYHYLNS